MKNNHIMKESTSTPYNIREKQEKNAAYRSLIRAELADELYDRILNIIIIEKRYRNKDFSAKELAVELGTNTRYISAVINSRFNTNFSCLVNEYRIKEAQHKLIDKRFQEMTIEEIGGLVGFANRQSFYASFYRVMGETPNNYRRRHTTIK
jgi:YesN/AraC family two-component response regulator